MATVEAGKPRVRAMQTAVVDEKGLTFCTGSHKNVARQLLVDPSVELSYWDAADGRLVRVRGEMEHVDDVKLKEHIVDQVFPFLKPVVEAHGHEAIALFRLSHGETRVWSSATGHQPPEVHTF